MLALFCLRLALGMLSALLLLRPRHIHPRFYRTHFLIALGLTSVAVLQLWSAAEVPVALWVALGLCFLGPIVWSVEGAPGGRWLIVLAATALGASLEWPELNGQVADDLASALLLGMAITAMLLGHSYLIAPGMTLVPLLTLLGGLFVALVLRAIIAGIGWATWTPPVETVSLNEVAVLWLPLRWGLGLIIPLVLAVLAWHTTRLRNTQSSTGILYIVVVFVCIGELTAQLLFNTTGHHL